MNLERIFSLTSCAYSWLSIHVIKSGALWGGTCTVKKRLYSLIEKLQQNKQKQNTVAQSYHLGGRVGRSLQVRGQPDLQGSRNSKCNAIRLCFQNKTQNENHPNHPPINQHPPSSRTPQTEGPSCNQNSEVPFQPYAPLSCLVVDLTHSAALCCLNSIPLTLGNCVSLE